MDSHDHEVLPLARPLTGRELEVLTHIGEGLANREIAEQMTVALSTVKWYVRQIYNKLGVQNRQEAIARAKDLGLLPDPETGDKYRLKIPSQLTSFVGRRREIGEVRQLLMTSRLVTLTGPGGSGKTRLAIQVARESAGQFGDGVFFVSLASTIDPTLVPNTIAQELGVDEQPNAHLIDALQSYFADKQLLLLIDSFEHLLDAASLVSDLLSVTTRLTILATSQEALHLSGEYEYLVPPLSIPDPSRIVSVIDLSKYESVALFVSATGEPAWHFNRRTPRFASPPAYITKYDRLELRAVKRG
jgi:DNA-binding CsgD family transcriptional regulator